MNDESKSIIAAASMAAAGAAVFLILPLLIGLLVDYRDLSEQEAGILASTYFATYLFSSASAYFWIHHVHWRPAAGIAYLLMIIGSSWTATAEQVQALGLGLAITGIGGGMLYALAVAIISNTRQPDRNFGWALAAQQLAAAGLYGVLPGYIIPSWGFEGSMYALGFILLVMSPFAVFAPNGQPEKNKDHTAEQSRSSPVRWGLFALVIHFTALSALWAFVERLGIAQELNNAAIGNALGLSMLAGLLGALTVGLIGNRYGRQLPLWCSAALFTLVGLGYGFGTSLLLFTLATGCFSFIWNFVLAYQMSIIAELDSNDRHAVLMPAAQALGATLGPTLGGLLIATGGYASLLTSTTLLALFAIGAFAVLSRALPIFR